MSKKIAVVIPCYNEEGNIKPMHDRLSKVFSRLTYNHEFIFVDNGSLDGSAEIFEALAKKDSHVIVLKLSRNFYKSQGAYTAGIDYSASDAVILIDGDIQDPPEAIPSLIKKWEEGFDIVYGSRIKRNDSFIRKISYKFFYRIFKKLSYINIPLDAGDFSLIDKKVVKIFKMMPEKNRYIRGLRAWVGFKSIGVEYERKQRHKGMTTNSFIDNIRWAVFAIFSFSYAPLELISWLAFGAVLMTGIATIYFSIRFFTYPGTPRGIQTLLIAVLFLGGVQLICFSIIAQYLGIMFEEIKKRPKYIVEKILKKNKT